MIRRSTAMCWWCKHFDDDHYQRTYSFRYTAFPDEIPGPIYNDHFDHRKPYPNDNGIQFEKLNVFQELKERQVFTNYQNMKELNTELSFNLELVDKVNQNQSDKK